MTCYRGYRITHSKSSPVTGRLESELFGVGRPIWDQIAGMKALLSFFASDKTHTKKETMKTPATFINNCVNTPPEQLEALNTLIDNGEDITRRAFLKHVDREQLRTLESELGYARHPRAGLTMAADWHVGYFRSVWDGRPAYFFRWSATEFYFA